MAEPRSARPAWLPRSERDTADVRRLLDAITLLGAAADFGLSAVLSAPDRSAAGRAASAAAAAAHASWRDAVDRERAWRRAAARRDEALPAPDAEAVERAARINDAMNVVHLAGAVLTLLLRLGQDEEQQIRADVARRPTVVRSLFAIGVHLLRLSRGPALKRERTRPHLTMVDHLHYATAYAVNAAEARRWSTPRIEPRMRGARPQRARASRPRRRAGASSRSSSADPPGEPEPEPPAAARTAA